MYGYDKSGGCEETSFRIILSYAKTIHQT